MRAAPPRTAVAETGAWFASGWRTIIGALRAMYDECREVSFAGPRARAATMTTLAVVLSVGVACAMHLPDVWWAAISGYMSSQPTRPASVKKGMMRIAGTVAGASTAVLLAEWLAYDQVACCLTLFTVSGIGIVGVNVSRHGYAWLFFAITFCIVLLTSLINPLDAFGLGVYRVIEVLIGTAAAIIVTAALAPDGAGKETAFPGWSGLLTTEWPVTLHGIRSGLAVAMIPIVWSLFYLPGLVQMAMTMTSVLATPVLGDPGPAGERATERAFRRVLGCLVGGLAALALLGLNLDSLLPWMALLGSGVWLFAYLQTGARAVQYVSIQAGIVFIMTLVQGEGPPSSIMPAVDRLVGMTLGLATLLVVALLVSSVDER